MINACTIVYRRQICHENADCNTLPVTVDLAMKAMKYTVCRVLCSGLISKR